MLKLRKIAITGGVSSGKSLVLSYFKEFGATVTNADEIVHKFLTPETKLGQKIIDLLGKDIVVKNKIDRSKVANIVFQNEKLLRALENILHPKVYNEIEKKYINARKKTDFTLFVAEIPLLFESGGASFFDKTVAVTTDDEIRFKRFQKSSGKDKEMFWQRSSFQLTQDKKVKRADFVINNNGSREELKKHVKTLMKNIS